GDPDLSVTAGHSLFIPFMFLQFLRNKGSRRTAIPAEGACCLLPVTAHLSPVACHKQPTAPGRRWHGAVGSVGERLWR
ncbi:hypothetical protein ACFVDH_31255, partial [Streptomyces sp. NPDC057674]|uniref:hypothetical protein n=1 Tax=Streptomyces sp. NPDC057674 TaxID=3346203 RepID=UPI00368E4A5C